MPKIESLDKAGELLVKAAQDLKKAMDAYGPEQGRRATSDQAVYGMLGVMRPTIKYKDVELPGSDRHESSRL